MRRIVRRIGNDVEEESFSQVLSGNIPGVKPVKFMLRKLVFRKSFKSVASRMQCKSAAILFSLIRHLPLTHYALFSCRK